MINKKICLGVLLAAAAIVPAACQSLSSGPAVAPESPLMAIPTPTAAAANPSAPSAEPESTAFAPDNHTAQFPPVTSRKAQITICSDEDFKRLSRLINLKELELSFSPGASPVNLEPLKGLTRLEKLSVAAQGIEDLTALSGLTSLKKLELGFNSIKDLSPLSSLVNLKYLDLAYNKADDLSPLSGLHNLKVLNLFNNNVRDLSPLSELHSLKSLELGYNNIEDLSPLSGLSNLRRLGLDENHIRDITPLSGLDSRTEVSLLGASLTWEDWFPINHLTKAAGRPPVKNAGLTPCPRAWVDRIQAQYPDCTILSLDYDDYDGNGTYEAFAFISPLPDSEKDSSPGILLSITRNSIRELNRATGSGLDSRTAGYYRFDKLKMVQLEVQTDATSSRSYLWTMNGTVPRSINLSGYGQGFSVDEAGSICLLDSVYDGCSDGTGHSYKPYYFCFNGHDFSEYGAIPISEKEFLTCRGADQVLNEVKKEGYTVQEILYRANGLIHLNLREKSDDIYIYFWRTLTLSEGRVSYLPESGGPGRYIKSMCDGFPRGCGSIIRNGKEGVKEIPVIYPPGFPAAR